MQASVRGGETTFCEPTLAVARDERNAVRRIASSERSSELERTDETRGVVVGGDRRPDAVARTDEIRGVVGDGVHPPVR